jgi:NADH dehydrogenase [ubiquinone] 1 alpha subcomplex assembly factor 6
MRRIVDARVRLSRRTHPKLTPRLVSPQQTEELKVPSQLTMDSLTAQAEATTSTHYYLLLSLLGISSDTLSHAASHLGIAHCISTLLRALPYHASKGRMVIPVEITARHRVSQEDVFRKGPAAKGIEEAVFEFATIANDNMNTAREMFKEDSGKVPRNAWPVFGAGASGAFVTVTGDKLI